MTADKLTTCDHGTALQAIDFALDHLWLVSDCPEPDTFLKAWREGDLDEWPEFYAWLAKVRTPHHPDEGVRS